MSAPAGTVTGPARASGPPVRVGRWLPPALAVVAAAGWLAFVQPVDPGRLGSFGVIAALHPAVPAALALLSVAFVVEVRSAAPRTWMLVGAAALAVAGMYGLQPYTEPVARLPVAWLHAGWADYIVAHGHVLHHFDARFSWPAFFGLVAWVCTAAGADPSALLAWAPPVFTGLAAIGVHAVASAVLGSASRPPARGAVAQTPNHRRAAWLAVWLFLVANWAEQDYFSPQGLSYLMYLAALGLTLRWLCRPALAEPAGRAWWRRTRPAPAEPTGRPWWRRDPPPDDDRRIRLAAAIGVVVLVCGLAPTHQVTPFALAGLLLVLAVAGRLWSPWLAVLALLVPLTWLVLGASDYWLGHMRVLLGGVGDVSGTVSQNVGDRFVGDAGRITVLAVRAGVSLLLVCVAAVGWGGLRTARGRPVALAVMALAPFGLLALQSYGGEILLRSYLYALPLLCTLGGAALERPLGARHRARGRLTAAALAVTLGAASVGLVTARGGNDAYVAFRTDDVAAVREAYALARPRQRITGLTAYLPLHWARIGSVTQLSLERQCPPGPREAGCVRRYAPDFVIVNHAQDSYGVILRGLRPGWTRTVVADLVASGEYRVRMRRGNTVLLVHVPLGGTR